MTKEKFINTVYGSEDAFTIATHRYINANYPQLRHMYFHVPNESATNKITRIKLWNMGVLAGVPDFIFVFPYLWCMELKLPNGTISPKQRALHELWRSKGITVEVCRTAAEVVQLLNNQFLIDGR